MTLRGRLFHKYAAVLILLVGGVLFASSVVNLYFSYQETKAALVRLERQQALSAASRVEQFVRGIEQQVRAAMEVPFSDAGMVREQREIDFLRLLRDVPAIIEIVQLDATGKVQLFVSRLAPNEIDSQRDLSRDPRFVKTRIGRTYFGPVRFRNESEPYFTLAVPWGEGAPEVVAADVDLRAIWHVISQIHVGATGYAYLVDGNGVLVAHPDMSLVLQKRDLSELPQVRAARAGPGSRDIVSETAGLQGGRALTSHAVIEPLGWVVFAEQPLAEAFAPLQGAIVLSTLFFVVGLGLSVLASVLLARRMVAPIRALQQGAAKIGAGELGHRIDVRTGGELEALGEEFNRTAGKLEESYASLEQKVETRTRELADANAGLSQSLEQQTATAEILRVISNSPTDVRPVFDAIVRSASRLCGGEYAIVTRYEGERLHLAAQCNPRPGTADETTRFFPLLPRRETSLVGRAFVDATVIHVPDVEAEEPTSAAREYHRRIGLRAVVAVPMVHEGRPIGVVSVSRAAPGPFADSQIGLLKTFADQAVIAIENVRLFNELQARTRDLTRSVDELQALGEVSRAVSSTLDLETVLNTIVARAVQLSGANGGVIYEYDESTQAFALRASHDAEEALIAAVQVVSIPVGEDALGRAATTQAHVELPDILDDRAPILPRAWPVLARYGYRSLLAMPLLLERRIMGGLIVWRREVGNLPLAVVNLLQTFATQSTLAIQNARLFREIEDKG